MVYTVMIRRAAKKTLARIAVPYRERVEDAIEDLADNPRPVGAIKLTGHSLYRIRVADYRIVYSVDDVVKIVAVETIGHRSNIYKEL